jgi:hypothetical protein
MLAEFDNREVMEPDQTLMSYSYVFGDIFWLGLIFYKLFQKSFSFKKCANHMGCDSVLVEFFFGDVVIDAEASVDYIHFNYCPLL